MVHPPSPSSSSSRALVLVVLFASLLVIASGRVARRDETKKGGDGEMLEKVVDAVERGLHFFSQDYSNVNVDGLFGIRLGQGQIMMATKECRSSGSCPDSLAQRLQVLSDGIDTTAEAAMKYVEEADREYFSRFLKTVNKPYLLTYRPVTLTDLDKTPAGSEAAYDEEEGDKCYARMMGTYKEHGKTIEQCNITQSCWDMMTQKGRSGYSVTHQLLYFIVAEMQGCVDTIEKSMDASIAEKEADMCGSIYNEAVSEITLGGGAVPDMLQDLFLEQVVLCGSLGFENFLRADWMRMVLRWQKPTGCFSLDSPSLLRKEEQLFEFKEQERHLMKDLKWEVDMIEKQHLQQRQGHERKLLREQVMTDGCLSHKSGLGFGTLSLFARYLVRHNFNV